MIQAARQLTDALDAFLADHRVLICDWDAKWTDRFRGLRRGGGARGPDAVPAPNANAHAERFVRSIRGECLDRLILFGERRLLRVLKELVVHYHNERNHQGLGNDLIAAPRAVSRAGIRYHDRLGSPLPYYYHAARAWDEFSDSTGSIIDCKLEG
jgi:putative transposase